MPQEQQAVLVPARQMARKPEGWEQVLRLILSKEPRLAKETLMVNPKDKYEQMIKALIDPDNTETWVVPKFMGETGEHDDIAKMLGFVREKPPLAQRRSDPTVNWSLPSLDKAIKKGMIRFGNFTEDYMPGLGRDTDFMAHYLPRKESHKLLKGLLQQQMERFPSQYRNVNLTFASPDKPIFYEGRQNIHVFGSPKHWKSHPSYRGEQEKALEFLEQLMSR